MYTTRPSRSDSRWSLPVFNIARSFRYSVIVHFMQDAAAARGERAVVNARRAAGVSRREALLAALALLVVTHHQVALHQVHLLPMVVHERLGRECAGLDLQQPGAAAALVLLIQVRRQDLLVEPRRISGRHFPPVLQVDVDELQVLFGLHAASASWSRTSVRATARSPQATSLAARTRSSRKRFSSRNSNSRSLTRRW